MRPYDAGGPAPGWSPKSSFLAFWRTEIPWLVVLTVWWMIASLSLPYVTNTLYTHVVVTLSPFWAGLASFGITNLLKRQRASGVVLSGLVAGIFGGWLGSLWAGGDEWPTHLGFTYGTLVGGAAANYFYSERKQTNLFWGLASTSLFVACIAAFIDLGDVIQGFSYSVSTAAMTVLVGAWIVTVVYFYKRGRQMVSPDATGEADGEDGDDDLDDEDADDADGQPWGRGKFVWILLVVALVGGLALWRRPALLRYVGLNPPSNSDAEQDEVPTVLTHDGGDYSMTLNGCRKEYFDSAFHVTCKLYVTNKTERDCKFILRPGDSIAVDDRGVDHTPNKGQMAEDALTNAPSKVIPRNARVVVNVIFGDVRRFKSAKLSLLRISIQFDDKEREVEFGEVRINNFRADDSWVDGLFGG